MTVSNQPGESKIMLPESLLHFFEESGYTSPVFFEHRRITRVNIRREAVMTIEGSPPSIQREPGNQKVLIKDVSRSGLSILVHEQLWPEERVFIRFLARQFRATVVRCRRLGEACWECGAEITAFENLEDDS